jgi:ABC-type antimicrobial peptide transport system, ATPase component
MAIIEMKQVYKTYHKNTAAKVEALKNASIKIEPGDFLAIMGESGSGKSTFLNVLTAIIKESSGDILINGKNTKDMTVDEISAIRYSLLCYIFQDFNLLNSLNIYENIALPLLMNGDTQESAKNKVKQVCGKLGITSLMDKYPNECSGGQRQRVAIARAMAAKPQIIVADEPTGNLDSSNSAEIMELFRELNAEGMTIVMVTHDSKIASYSKQMIYIHDGSIIKKITKKTQTDQEYHKDIVAITSVRGVFV